MTSMDEKVKKYRVEFERKMVVMAFLCNENTVFYCS